ncbi:MAG: alpha/beta fold hydrolase [Anaerolineae bacterium]|nr:alpha/beta fold hydrolase [Anaerolineae bacterium]
MRNKLILALLIGLYFAAVSLAQPPPPPETITRPAADDTALVADFYPASEDAPALILLHMLNSRRGAWNPLIPDLHEAGYAILNIDMRGHGDSDGEQDWDAIIADMAGWVDWLAQSEHSGVAGLAFIGGSIGANVALISCAENDACRGAIALSPGLDYRGVKPEPALVDGLAERLALLVAAQADSSSSTAIRQMFLNAKGDVSARIYPGRAHGTRLLDSRYDSVSGLILGWLAELFAADE